MRIDPKLAAVAVGCTLAGGALTLLGVKLFERPASPSSAQASSPQAIVQASPLSPTGLWEVRSEVSALDGSKTLTARLPAGNDVWNLIGRKDRPLLEFGCSKQGIYAAILWPDFIDNGTHRADLRWRLDEGPVNTTSMPVTEQAIGQRRDLAVDWIRTLSTGRRLVVQVPDRHGGQEATFNLEGVVVIGRRFTEGSCR